jgi:hypothetical protein
VYGQRPSHEQYPTNEQRQTNEPHPIAQQVSAQSSTPPVEKDEPITYEEPQIIESHSAQKFGGNDIHDDELEEEIVEETPKKKGWMKWWPF